MSILLRLFLVTTMLGMGGCSMFSSDDELEPAELVDFDETVDVDRKWSNRIGEQGEPELYIRLMPVIEGDRIFVASTDGEVTALEREDGDDVWDVDTDANLISAVGSGDGLVFVGTENGVLIALEQTDGKERWRVPLSSEMLAAASAADGIVVAQSIDGKVVGLATENGEKRWQYSASIPSLTLRASASPVIEQGMVFLAFANGRVAALRLDNGLQVWEQQVSLPEGRSELERLIDFDGRPVLLGDDLFVASYQGHAAMLDRQRGQLQWLEKMSAMGQLATGHGNLYITQPDDTIVALKLATGRHLWENKQLARRQLTAPAVIGDFVAVADFDGYIHLMNSVDGQFAARYSLWCSDGVRNALFNDDNTLFVLANSGKLTALILDQ